jgi:hypothetical protein
MARRRNSDVRLQRALERDEDDQAQLRSIERILLNVQDELVPYVAPLRHPKRKFHPGEVTETIKAMINDIRDELEMISKGPVYIDEDC